MKNTVCRKILQLIGSMSLMLLLTTNNGWVISNGWAAKCGVPPGCVPDDVRQNEKHAVPEINPSKGTTAIALLVGALLLVAEKSRRKK